MTPTDEHAELRRADTVVSFLVTVTLAELAAFVDRQDLSHRAAAIDHRDREAVSELVEEVRTSLDRAVESARKARRWATKPTDEHHDRYRRLVCAARSARWIHLAVEYRTHAVLADSEGLAERVQELAREAFEELLGRGGSKVLPLSRSHLVAELVGPSLCAYDAVTAEWVTTE